MRITEKYEHVERERGEGEEMSGRENVPKAMGPGEVEIGGGGVVARNQTLHIKTAPSNHLQGLVNFCYSHAWGGGGGRRVRCQEQGRWTQFYGNPE